MEHEMLIQVLGKDHDLCSTIQAMVESDCRSVITAEDEVDDNTRVSATIVCLDEVPGPGSLFTNMSMLSSRLIVVSETFDPQIHEWATHNNAFAYFSFPFSSHLLITELESISREYNVSEIEDSVIIEFLRSLQYCGIKMVTPVLDQMAPLNHHYPLPDVKHIRRYDQRTLLEYCADSDLFKRHLFNKVHTCPSCSSERIHFREVCPRCGSIDIHKQQIVHHFSCGHVAPVSDFTEGSKLICPKCGKELKHIGADYEKPTDFFMCRACDFICPEPAIEYQCFRCESKGDPETTKEINIYSYEMTDIATQAIATGKLGTIDMETILFNKYTGLYNKEYMFHELARGIEYYQRYKLPFSFMIIRVDPFEEVRIKYPDKLQFYVDSIFSCVSKQLRLLDTICVWNNNMLAMVCGGTDAAGASIVANRMSSNAAELEFLYEFAKPQLTICLNECTDEITDSQQLIDLTLQEFDDEQQDT